MIFDDMIKKITIGISIPLFVAILGWATWMTRQAFSAQRTEVILTEHKIEADKNRSLIQQELEGLNNIITQNFNSLNKKIDKNTMENNKTLLDLQKQIGELNK